MEQKLARNEGVISGERQHGGKVKGCGVTMWNKN